MNYKAPLAQHIYLTISHSCRFIKVSQTSFLIFIGHHILSHREPNWEWPKMPHTKRKCTVNLTILSILQRTRPFFLEHMKSCFTNVGLKKIQSLMYCKKAFVSCRTCPLLVLQHVITKPTTSQIAWCPKCKVIHQALFKCDFITIDDK